MSIIQQLYDLQQVDLERDRLRQRLKEIVSQLGETEELRQARATVERLHSQLGQQRARRRDLELETQTLEAKIASVEERLYGGRVTNPKELTDLQRDAAALRKQRSALDEKSLQVMMTIEENEAALTKAQARLDALQADWTTLQGKLLQERARLEAQLAEQDKQRAEHSRAIPAELVARYGTLRRTKNGMAVAVVQDNCCSVCGVELADNTLAQLALDELVVCTNCERILFE